MSTITFRAWLGRTLLIGFTLAGIVGCGMNLAPAVTGSGVMGSEKRDVGGFATVTNNISANLDITVGPATEGVIEADDNLLPLITTEVRGSELIIGSRASFNSRRTIKLTIQTPSLAGLVINGSGDAVVRGVQADSFSGTINGSGKITATGSARQLHGTIAGSGDLLLSELSAGSATISIAGSGSASVSPSDSLNATVTGSGDIRYKPSPALSLQKQITGSGSVRPM